jgi:hypothetical protein
MLQAYLDRFPEGVFAPLAKIKLDKLYKVEGSQDSSIRTFEGVVTLTAAARVLAVG